MTTLDELTRCRELSDLQYVAPGWGCCKCRIYNGARNRACRNCGHEPCLEPPERARVVAAHNKMFPYLAIAVIQ